MNKQDFSAIMEEADASTGDDMFDMDDEFSVSHRDSLPKKEKIGEKEDKVVFCMRMVVILVLLGTALAASTLIHKYLSDEEKRSFHNQFDSDVNKIFESIGTTLDNTMGPADALIVNTLAYAKATNSKFPFVTLPSYGLQAAKLLRISKGFQMHMSFEVGGDQQEEWEAYSNSHLDAIDDALDILEGDPDWYGPIYSNYRTCPHIYSWGGVPLEKPNNVSHTYMPNWHEYPISSGSSNVSGGCPYNIDHFVMPDVFNAVMYMKMTQQAVIANFPNVNFNVSDPEQAMRKKILNAAAQKLLPPGVDASEPFTQIGFPIFESTDSVYVDTSKPQVFVGFLALSIMFRDLIENLLPENSNGIYLVLEQGCGVPFTYRLDGPTATFVGVGSLQEEKYEDMVATQDLASLMDSTQSDRDSSYTGIPISTEFCPNTLRIYPSAEMEANHTTNNPMIMAVVSAAIFLFTSLTFITYDYVSERRQRLVKKRALESGAIVSSLFPEDVRNRLYEENRGKQTKQEKLKKFEAGQQSSSVQIAQNYPNTTVFMGDLAGFTKWSADRTPTEVFDLLEALYGSFDEVARKLRVYKVETIGDCYVAITGCPNQQDDHASRIVRFAKECMARTTTVTQELSDKLGADTMDLRFRVGLHSGSVTAGVLRGERGRFQLFGDTVNTSSRMESNGVKGRIHCSEETMKALRAEGKGSWVVAREDKIVAKGKGELQTYFIETARVARSATSQRSSDRMSATASSNDKFPLVHASNNVTGSSRTSYNKATESQTSFSLPMTDVEI